MHFQDKLYSCGWPTFCSGCYWTRKRNIYHLTALDDDNENDDDGDDDEGGIIYSKKSNCLILNNNNNKKIRSTRKCPKKRLLC